LWAADDGSLKDGGVANARVPDGLTRLTYEVARTTARRRLQQQKKMACTQA